MEALHDRHGSDWCDSSACAEDLAGYASSPSLAGNREGVYNGVAAKVSELQDALISLTRMTMRSARYCADNDQTHRD